jgi:hypothetical protein
VLYPSSSVNVIAVGGTRLSLNPDGTVISETGWNGSGGGVSAYEPIPAYQTNYGLTTTKRAVPDVSFNADPNTGVSVYYSGDSSTLPWYKIGGTSAGAPQWAAIHALGLSATNTNLYLRANFAYSSYFRDITSGSNGGYNATAGYDLVTGLGSPLTFNFGALAVSPSSGPAGASIILDGIGFLGSSVNISYLNPINSFWIPVVNNLATTTGNFSYNFNAPDLLQSNPLGDNQPLFDNIVFRAQDNSNGRSYNTAIPYTEWRRGLTQVGNFTTQGLLGNNTNLATSVFVQNGDTVPFSGSWFSPGSMLLFWDNTNLGIIPTDGNGFFNTAVTVPNTPTGQHTITISDGAVNFCVNLTRLPRVGNDYMDGWHTSDFNITLTPDYLVNETFYRINDGPVFNVAANGQPTIKTEGSSNTLEYWSSWDIYGTGISELPHVTVTGIKLDKTAPLGTITTGSTTTQTPTIALTLSATDSTSGIAQMRFSNDNATWSGWEPYATSKTWALQSGDGQKTVTTQFMDNAGLTSTSSYEITLVTPQPTAIATSSPAPTTSPTLRPTPVPTISPLPMDPQTATPSVPEASGWVLIVFVLCTLMLVLLLKKRRVA